MLNLVHRRVPRASFVASRAGVLVGGERPPVREYTCAATSRQRSTGVHTKTNNSLRGRPKQVNSLPAWEVHRKYGGRRGLLTMAYAEGPAEVCWRAI